MLRSFDGALDDFYTPASAAEFLIQTGSGRGVSGFFAGMGAMVEAGTVLWMKVGVVDEGGEDSV